MMVHSNVQCQFTREHWSKTISVRIKLLRGCKAWRGLNVRHLVNSWEAVYPSVLLQSSQVLLTVSYHDRPDSQPPPPPPPGRVGFSGGRAWARAQLVRDVLEVLWVYCIRMSVICKLWYLLWFGVISSPRQSWWRMDFRTLVKAWNPIYLLVLHWDVKLISQRCERVAVTVEKGRENRSQQLWMQALT